MNEFLCGFEVPSLFFCFDGGNMTRPYKTVKDFEDCVAVAFRCPESPATIPMAAAFKGFYPEEEEEVIVHEEEGASNEEEEEDDENNL